MSSYHREKFEQVCSPILFDVFTQQHQHKIQQIFYWIDLYVKNDGHQKDTESPVFVIPNLGERGKAALNQFFVILQNVFGPKFYQTNASEIDESLILKNEPWFIHLSFNSVVDFQKARSCGNKYRNIVFFFTTSQNWKATEHPDGFVKSFHVPSPPIVLNKNEIVDYFSK